MISMNARYPPIQRLTLERARALAAHPAREQLLDRILSASTPEAIEAARQEHLAWLIENPDDIGMLEAGETLAYAEETFTEQDQQQPHQPGPPSVGRKAG